MITIDVIKSAKSFLNDRFYDIDMSPLMYCASGDDCDFTQYCLGDLEYFTKASWVRSGASKIVMYFSDFSQDYVFKIPFKGWSDVIWNDKRQDWDILEENDYINAGIDNYNSWDYCETESMIYKKSRDKRISQCFAQTIFLGYIFGIPFYISEKANVRGNVYHRKCSETSKTIGNRIYKSFNITNFGSVPLGQQAINLFIEDYGVALTYDLLDFLIAEDINDLHYANLGLTNDNKVVIIDYSGFND